MESHVAALEREVAAFDLEQPERYAPHHIAAGDQRVLAVHAYGPTFPGILEDASLAHANSPRIFR